MRAIVFSLWLALSAAAMAQDKDPEQTAIERTIERLKFNDMRAAQFTKDADGAAEFEKAMQPSTAMPHSDAPMSEQWPFPPRTPSILSTHVRLLTADVALADGTVGGRPLLFVMKKEDGAWKVASVRFLKEK